MRQVPDERGHPVQSEVIRRNQMPSVVISGHHAPMMAFVLNSPAADACGVPSTARPVGVTPVNESAVLVTEQGLPKPERGPLRRVRVLGHIEQIEAVTQIDARTRHLEALAPRRRAVPGIEAACVQMRRPWRTFHVTSVPGGGGSGGGGGGGGGGGRVGSCSGGCGKASPHRGAPRRIGRRCRRRRLVHTHRAGIDQLEVLNVYLMKKAIMMKEALKQALRYAIRGPPRPSDAIRGNYRSLEYFAPARIRQIAIFGMDRERR